MDESLISKSLDSIYDFSCACGLKWNISKCEIMPIYDLNYNSIENIPIKSTVKYWSIYITKNCTWIFHPGSSNLKNILISWLLRDLSLYGRTLLSKAEGLSHFAYPSLSLFVENKSFCFFFGKLNHINEKRKCLLIFLTIHIFFKMNWLKRCLANPKSIWYFIPNHIFDKIGSLSFILKGNYLPSKPGVIKLDPEGWCPAEFSSNLP